MADFNPFKVIIAGGGVAGLTVANALEKANIDFIMLEGREVAPQLGASICIQGHTIKILEQLCVWEKLREATVPILDRQHYDENGNLFATSTVFKQVLDKTKRPIVFMERRVCLEALFNNIGDKSKIRTHTRVVSFSEDDSGVTVTTDRGESVRGSILIAADGVHSTVRQLIADTISAKGHERYSNLTSGFTSGYRVVFGTSSNSLGKDGTKPALPHGVGYNTYYRNVSGIATAGVNDIVFWFLFVKEDTASKAPDCPRYTDTDAAATIEEYGGLLACPNYTFRDLWETRIKAGMVPMEEGVLQGPWNNGGRVVLVGDAVHKTTVNAGFGGNLAVEGVGNIVNELVPLLQRTQTPAPEDIVAVFDRYEEKQRPRADLTVKLSNHTTRYESMDTLFLRILRWLSPWIPEWYGVKLILSYLEPAPFLRFLPDPDIHKAR
ncbi:FAD/NAD(P)-binding domain-containing protein [Hypoxylon sp. NC1633]|nr:FAD/NAD(P)-binding domain-containing protein [Hypoxylon sp. NC1633]